MDKARRHELKMLNYFRRLRNLRLKHGEGKFYAYQSHGAPCSCSMCSHAKFNRAKVKRQQQYGYADLTGLNIAPELNNNTFKEVE